MNHRHADFQSRTICGCSVASAGKNVKPEHVLQTLSGKLSNVDDRVLTVAMALADGLIDLWNIESITQTFQLTDLQAYKASALANKFRTCRKAFG